jgi:hypothetical protein
VPLQRPPSLVGASSRSSSNANPAMGTVSMAPQRSRIILPPQAASRVSCDKKSNLVGRRPSNATSSEFRAGLQLVVLLGCTGYPCAWRGLLNSNAPRDGPAIYVVDDDHQRANLYLEIASNLRGKRSALEAPSGKNMTLHGGA